jgi:DNA processing protein
MLARHLTHGMIEAIKVGPEPALLEQTGSWLAQQGNHLLAWDDPDYPAQLLTIADPPPLLYAKGRLDLLRQPSVAMVGSRNATPQGKETAKAFARSLSDANVTVVSGLALGIDAAAHEGALCGPGSTIAVVGTGLDRIYPARNREIARTIAEQGLLVSEFSLGTPPLAGNFPRRNRILSGLARACLVVEATIQSGSLITARFAAEQGRDVFAIPGSIHSPFAKGCHKLIKEGAKLVECAQDVLEELRLESPVKSKGQHRDRPESPEAECILEAMGYDVADVDTICRRAEMPADRVLSGLLELELTGRVGTIPGGRYQRLA